MSKTITSAEYNAWLEPPLTKGLKRSFQQSITDPENQPSQYGTVTLEMYEALESEITTLKSALKVAHENLDAIRFAVEPYDDIKPRDWKSDRANLRDAHQCAIEALAKINEVLKP